MKRTFAALGLALLAAACAPGRVEAPEPDAEFTSQAVRFLDGLQVRSFAENREYCGYFGRDAEGDFVAGPPAPGGEYWCDPVHPPGVEIVASYHTHGAHGVEFIAEVPSPEDVDTDVAEGVFGYVATPGGRVWLVDWRDATVRQLCGLACIRQDPNYDAREAGPVGRVYTREGLAVKFGY